MLFNLGDGVSHQLRRRVRIIAFYRFLSGEARAAAGQVESVVRADDTVRNE